MCVLPEDSVRQKPFLFTDCQGDQFLVDPINAACVKLCACSDYVLNKANHDSIGSGYVWDSASQQSCVSPKWAHQLLGSKKAFIATDMDMVNRIQEPEPSS